MGLLQCIFSVRMYVDGKLEFQATASTECSYFAIEQNVSGLQPVTLQIAWVVSHNYLESIEIHTWFCRIWWIQDRIQVAALLHMWLAAQLCGNEKNAPLCHSTVVHVKGSNHTSINRNITKVCKVESLTIIIMWILDLVCFKRNWIERVVFTSTVLFI